MTAGLAIGFVVGALVAVVVTILLREARAGREETAHAVSLGRARSEVEQLEAELESERRRRCRTADGVGRGARRARRVSSRAFRRRRCASSNEQFLQLAKGRLELAQQAAKGDLDQRTQSIEQLLTPLREQLGRYEEGAPPPGVRPPARLCGPGPAGEAAQRLPGQAPIRDPQPRHRAPGARHQGALGRAPAAPGDGDGGDARALRLRRAGDL